jgi:hypothetical protein
MAQRESERFCITISADKNYLARTTCYATEAACDDHRQGSDTIVELNKS